MMNNATFCHPFKSSFNLFTLKVRARKFFKAILKKKGLTSLSYFSYPLVMGSKELFTSDAGLLRAKAHTIMKLYVICCPKQNSL
jgi:hypothetical protein